MQEGALSLVVNVNQVEVGAEGLTSGERRANVRLSRVLAVALELDGEYRNGVAVDLSVTGFQVASDFALGPGQIVPVRLHLARHNPLQARAQVVWCQEIALGMFQIGFQIEEVSSQKAFLRLCRYIDKEMLNAASKPGPTDTLDLSTQVTLRTMSGQELDRFAALAHISELLNGSQNLDELLDRALKIVVEATGAERGMMILDRGTAGFEVPVFHAKSRNESRGFSSSVVEAVRNSEQPLLSLDAQVDERFAESGSLKVMGTRSVLCVPIRTRQQGFCMLYLDNSVRAGAVNEADLRLADLLSNMVASAIERAESFAQLVQHEKLATIGTLTACFLHDLSNPLTSILGIGEMLHADDTNELTSLLVEEAKRCNQLMNDLLRLTRKEPLSLTEVNLPEVLHSATGALTAEITRRQIDLILPPADLSVPTILGNADHLRQVFLNLLTNALHAVSQRPGGRIEVSVSTSCDFVMVQVKDNGDGILPQNLKKVFEPFFTTRGPGQGTGLGLSIIARIVSEHGGRIKTENRPEGGALFEVSLPTKRSRQRRLSVSN